MQVSLVNPPKIFARNPAGRMVQIAGRAGDIGKFENVVVPDERVICHLRPVIRYLEKLQPRRFEYDSVSGYTKHQQPRQPGGADPVNGIGDLPRFRKR